MKALATEMTTNFAARLAPLGLQVHELTGDTSLSRKKMAETQVCIVHHIVCKNFNNSASYYAIIPSVFHTISNLDGSFNTRKMGRCDEEDFRFCADR